MSFAITRQKGSSMDPGNVHFIVRDGSRVYRVWSHRSDEYVTGELTEAELRDYLLRQALTTVISDELSPISFHQRDLTGKDWWTEDREEVGILETHMATEKLDLLLRYRSSKRLAEIAVAAINAYKAHIEAGGDPSCQPVVSFADTATTVAMQEGNEG